MAPALSEEGRVRASDPYRLTGKIQEHLLPCTVMLPKDHVDPGQPRAIQPAEPTVTTEHPLIANRFLSTSCLIIRQKDKRFAT